MEARRISAAVGTEVSQGFTFVHKLNLSHIDESDDFFQVFEKNLTNTAIVRRAPNKSVESWKYTYLNHLNCKSTTNFARITNYGKNFALFMSVFNTVNDVECLVVAHRDCSITLSHVKTARDECEDIELPHLHLVSSILDDNVDSFDLDVVNKYGKVNMPIVPVDLSINNDGSMISVSLADFSVAVLRVEVSSGIIGLKEVRRIDSSSVFFGSSIDSNISSNFSMDNFSVNLSVKFSNIQARRILCVSYPGKTEKQSKNEENMYVRTGSIELARAGIMQNFDTFCTFKVKAAVSHCCFSPVTENMLALCCVNGDVIIASNVIRERYSLASSGLKLENTRDEMHSPSYLCWHPNESCLIAFSNANLEKETGDLRFHHITIYDLSLQPVHTFCYSVNFSSSSSVLLTKESFHNSIDSNDEKGNMKERATTIDSTWISSKVSNDFIVLKCSVGFINKRFIIFPFSIAAHVQRVFRIGEINVRSLLQMHLNQANTAGVNSEFLLAGNLTLKLLELPFSHPGDKLSAAALFLRDSSAKIETEDNISSRDKLQFYCGKILKKLRERVFGSDFDYFDDIIKADKHDENEPSSNQRISMTRKKHVYSLERRYLSQLIRLGQLESAFQFAQHFASVSLHKDAFEMFNDISMWSKIWKQPMCEKLSTNAYIREKRRHEEKLKLYMEKLESYSEEANDNDNSFTSGVREGTQSLSQWSSEDNTKSFLTSGSEPTSNAGENESNYWLSETSESESNFSATIRTDIHEHLKKLGKFSARTSSRRLSL